MIQAYATTTRTKRNIEALRDAGWRLLLTPDINDDWGMPYALDNGAFGCYLRGEPFNAERFRKLLHTKGPRADWVVVPDIVAGGVESFDFSLGWIHECRQWCRLCLLAVQDGMMPEHVVDHLEPDVGIFVGGTVDWKLRTLPQWGEVAALFERYLHVGRVNTARRIRYCQSVGADSFDGTSATRFSKSVPMLNNARRQQAFVWSG